MKIAFDHQIFTYQSYGGISRYYASLADELYKFNQSVKIFAGLYQNNYLEYLPSEIVKGIKVKNYPKKSSGFFNLLNYGHCKIQLGLSNHDILHETYYSNLPSFKFRGCRVTTVYDMIHEIFRSSFSDSENITRLKKATFSRVDHIISISQSTKNDLITMFEIPENKISVVHLGVDLSSFQSKKSKINVTRKPYLLFVGSRSGYKNFERLIRAYSSSDRLIADFDLIAFGSNSFNLDENELLKRLGLSNGKVIHVTGNDQILAELYSSASAFIYPSLYEGFGLPPLEAMASGCPVISSSTSSMPEVIREAGEFFNPMNIENIREAIENVVYSSSRTNELIKLGYQNIKDFSWHKCAAESLNIYRNLL